MCGQGDPGSKKTKATLGFPDGFQERFPSGQKPDGVGSALDRPSLPLCELGWRCLL